MTILEKMFVFKECILSLVKKSDLLLQPRDCTCTTVFYMCYDLASEQSSSIKLIFDHFDLVNPLIFFLIVSRVDPNCLSTSLSAELC